MSAQEPGKDFRRSMIGTLRVGQRDAQGDDPDPEFTFSSDSYVPQDGWVLPPRACDLGEYQKNPVVYYDHQFHDSVPFPIGSAHSVVVADRAVIGRIKFSDAYDKARLVRDLINEGHLRAASIRFQVSASHIPSEDERTRYGIPRDDSWARIADSWVPKETSIVGLPADGKALKRAVDLGLVAAADVARMAETFRSIQPPAAPAATQPRSSMIRAIAQQLGLRLADNADDAAVRAAVCQKLNLNEAASDNAILAAMGQRASADAVSAAENAAKLERDRVAGIEELGKRHSLPPEMVKKLVTDGTKIELARGLTLEYIASRTASGGVASLGGDPNPDLNDKEKGKYSMLRAVQAWLDNDWTRAGFERECSQEISKRSGRGATKGFYMPTNIPFYQRLSPAEAARAAYSVTTGNTGGVLVAQQLLAGSFIELLRNKAKVIQAGARILAGLVGNIDIPRQKTAGTAYWLGDGANPPEAEAQFELVGMTPKTVGAYSLVTRNMLLQATPDIEMLSRADMLAIIALALDAAALYGSGTGGQPQGIANTPGIGSVVGGTNGAQFTLDNFIDLETQVTAQNVPEDALGYIINAKTIGWLKKQKSSTGQYLWNGPWNGLQTTPDFRPGSYPLNNFPAYRSNQARSNLVKGSSGAVCSEAFFADWSELLIGEWGVLEVLPNPYGAAYQQGGIELRALQSVDVAPRHPVSFATMSDGLTA